jgi:hypothetical protein
MTPSPGMGSTSIGRHSSGVRSIAFDGRGAGTDTNATVTDLNQLIGTLVSTVNAAR